MIIVTRLDGSEYFINPHQIESMESLPDTILQMLSGKRVVILEKPELVLERIIEYRSRIGGFKSEE